jgi:two-component system phosphate regulon sensor histidine kinase PhoR
MTLRSRTLRLGIFISTLVAAAIICFQLVWLNKVYRLEQKQFDHAIARTVRSLYNDFGMDMAPDYNLSDLIVTQNSQTFFIRIGRPLRSDSLGWYVNRELESEDVFVNTYVGIYDGSRQRYTFTTFLPSATAPSRETVRLPEPGVPGSFLTLYFPGRSRYILSLMNYWIIGSLVLLAVLLLLGSSLYYFYREKFLNETQRDFVNNFTHEFKTPVAIISLAAEALERPSITGKPEKLLRYAGIIKEQVGHLESHIGRLLTHAHSESQQLHLQLQPTDLHLLTEAAITNLEPLSAARGAQLEVHLEADRHHLLADPGYLQVVITNLLENGIRYSPEPRIIVRTFNENGSLILLVKDNGIGIEKKHLRAIFRKFYRVPTGDQASARGFGLGLAFVKRIVQAHHGRISVESTPGVGSEFRVKLQVLNHAEHG